MGGNWKTSGSKKYHIGFAGWRCYHVVWIFQELAKLFQIFFNMHHNEDTSYY
jgi:hypothetical protein